MHAAAEQRVSILAQRIGLQLSRTSAQGDAALYRLVEPETRQPIFPGNGGGAALPELEDWLRFPWE